MTEFFNLEGQKFSFNPEDKRLKTTIDEAFMKAGSILGWQSRFNNNPVGLGFNKNIIEKCIRYNSHLIVFVVKVGNQIIERDYFLAPDKLKQFLLHNNHEYKTPKGVWVDVIPFDLFTHRMVHVS